MSFTAAYPGECGSCGNQVLHTDVVYVDDELVHVVCPPDPTTLARPTCPACFTELPVSGVCDCS